MVVSNREDVEKILGLFGRMETDEALGKRLWDDARSVLVDEGINQEVIDIMINGSYGEVRDLFEQANMPVPKIWVRGPKY